MGSIYSHAQLVICATSAQASTDGFLPKEDCATTWKHVNHLSPSGDLKCRAASRSHKPRETSRDGPGKSPVLNKRAWTTQEGILPHRLLHFDSNEIIWECDTSSVCECGNVIRHGLWKDLYGDLRAIRSAFKKMDWHSYGKPSPTSRHITNRLGDLSLEEKLSMWAELVRRYTLRSLTVPSDKLPAISGLARLFQAYMDIPVSDYVAGLWKFTLPVGLLWYVQFSGAKPKPQPWRAPSWSWASVDGDNITFLVPEDSTDMVEQVHILECHCAPLSVDAFGQVREGYIRLRCELIAVELQVAPNYSDASVSNKDQTACPVLLDSHETEADALANEHYCMKVITWSKAGKTAWLVLRKCDNTVTGHGQLDAFERVGMVDQEMEEHDRHRTTYYLANGEVIHGTSIKEPFMNNEVLGPMEILLL